MGFLLSGAAGIEAVSRGKVRPGREFRAAVVAGEQIDF
jgi:hypothetical protein